MPRPGGSRVLGRPGETSVAGKMQARSRGDGTQVREAAAEEAAPDPAPRSSTPRPSKAPSSSAAPNMAAAHGSPAGERNCVRQAPEVAGGPAPYPGLCGSADAPALSIPGGPGGSPGAAAPAAAAPPAFDMASSGEVRPAPLSALLPAPRPWLRSGLPIPPRPPLRPFHRAP